MVSYEEAVNNLQSGGLTGKAFDDAKANLDNVYGRQGLSGGNSPAPGAVPPPAADTPLPAGKSSPLLDFASALEQAVTLARSSRNKDVVDIMQPYKGTAAASDFGALLGHFNAASDKTSSDLITRATDLSKGDIITATDDNGTVHGIDKNTGKVVWSTPGVGNRDNGGPGGVLITSGGLTYNRSDYSDDASVLEQSRGADGWVDPDEYQRLYDNWVSAGGKIADFVRTFPPAQYINPENDWLPPYLRPKKAAGSVPTSFSEVVQQQQ